MKYNELPKWAQKQIKRMLTDCDIEVVADEEKPIWCDTKFLKPPTLDK